MKNKFNILGKPTEETKLRADIAMHGRTIDDLVRQINNLKSFQQKMVDWIGETIKIGNDAEHDLINDAVAEAWVIVDKREY